MAGDATQRIDSALLEKFREGLRQRAAHPTRLIAIAFLRQGFVSFLLLFVVLPLVTGRPVFGETLTGRKAVILGSAVLIMASLSAFLNYRGTRDTLSVGLNEHQNLLTVDWSRWAGNGWLRRTFGMGAMITAAIGLPIGALQAVTLPITDLPSGSRSLMVFIFVGLTALWAFPMAFGIRWLVLREYRSLTPASR